MFYAKMMLVLSSFLFNETATTVIYTLSLHDALPISLLLRLLLPPVQVSVALFCSTRPASSSNPEALIVVGPFRIVVAAPRMSPLVELAAALSVRFAPWIEPKLMLNAPLALMVGCTATFSTPRSEARRVGKGCGSR